MKRTQRFKKYGIADVECEFAFMIQEYLYNFDHVLGDAADQALVGSRARWRAPDLGGVGWGKARWVRQVSMSSCLVDGPDEKKAANRNQMESIWNRCCERMIMVYKKCSCSPFPHIYCILVTCVMTLMAVLQPSNFQLCEP